MAANREQAPLNNNRGSNSNNSNRRRGRGSNSNRPGGGGGGGQQLNRVDSRARGNAPQMLEKYRKLAHDAHLNGDRVQEEYYLQFADHYFRVIADTRVRQEEQRARREDRGQDGSEPPRDESDDAGEFGSDNEYPAFDSPPSYVSRREREERGEAPRRREERGPRPERTAQTERTPYSERLVRNETPAPAAADQPATAAEPAAANPYEPPENPFVRTDRPTRGLRPRRDDRRPRREEGAADADDAPAGLDPSSLPPAIGALAPAEPEAAAEVAETKPRRGRPRKKPVDDAAGEPLESVN